MRRLIIFTALLLGQFGAGPFTPPASACPMCKLANESDNSMSSDENRKPQAYMYSILFMIAMPATMLGAFGFAFWRMSKKAESIDETFPGSM